MFIKTIRIKNFRCLKDVTLECGDLTALIGRNGSGKSAVLRALDIFYKPAADYSEEDFYNRDTSQPICISVTFSGLTPYEQEFFSSHLSSDGTLTVEKELVWPKSRTSQRYYGYIKRCPDFDEIRKSSRVVEKRQKYQELRSQPKFSDLDILPGNASREQIEEALKRWEQNHPDCLEWARDEGQFFGFKEVGQAKLERFTRFVFIPAVREAAEDATEGKGSVITEIMDIVVRSTLSQREDIAQLRQETKQRYDEIMDISKLPELKGLRDDMDYTLKTFAPGVGLDIEWAKTEEINIPFPKANIWLIEDGYRTSVERAGHGSQRAFILTALQHLALAQAKATSTTENVSDEGTTAYSSTEEQLPNLILGIEEVELYQHPSRQRHLANILLKLSSDGIPGVGKIQIIYTTHSPLLIDLQRFNQIRLFRKIEGKIDEPKQTKIYQASLEDITRKIEWLNGAQEESYALEGTRARFHTLMTPWTNEGFFADVVVLVEGEGDRAAILGMAKLKGHDFEALDIAVIPCNGKTNLPKAILIFQAFEIPVYTLWDCDEGGRNPKPEYNRKLLRLFGQAEEDYTEKVESRFACFRKDMISTLQSAIGRELFEETMEALKDKYGYQTEDAYKKPKVIEELLQIAYARGKRCLILEKIVDKIVHLRGHISGVIE